MKAYKSTRLDFGTIGGLFLATAFIFGLAACVTGWVWNIIKFFGMIDGSVTTMFVARIIGMFFAPLGVVLGYM